MHDKKILTRLRKFVRKTSMYPSYGRAVTVETTKKETIVVPYGKGDVTMPYGGYPLTREQTALTVVVVVCVVVVVFLVITQLLVYIFIAAGVAAAACAGYYFLVHRKKNEVGNGVAVGSGTPPQIGNGHGNQSQLPAPQADAASSGGGKIPDEAGSLVPV